MYYLLILIMWSPFSRNEMLLKFWNTASVKRSADVTRLQALVDKKKIVLSENVIRQILQLDDAEGVVCLPNEKIFAGLAQMGYEKPQLAEEELAEEQVQVDDAVAAVQENVAEDVTYDAIPSPPSHDIPSPSQVQSSPPQQPQSSPQAPPQGAEFPPHIQQVLDERVKRLEKANMVKYSKLRRLRKVGASRRIESSDDMEDVFNQGRMIDDMDKDEGIKLIKDADDEGTELAEIYHLDLDHSSKVLSMQEDDSKVQEVVEVVTTAKLITDVVTAASQVSAASATISAAKPSIPAAALTVVAAYTRRRKGVIIRDPEEELSLKTPAETPKLKDKGKGILIETPKPMKKKDQIEMDTEYAKKLHEEINKDHEEINKDIDWDAAMDHVNQKSKNPQYIKRYQGMKKRHQTESKARKNMMIYLKNNVGYKMDFFKGMSYAEICPIFQARFKKAAKRRKLSEEAQEAEDLKKRLEVVDDEDDDVFIKATRIARKVPVVDYHIVLVDNKPRFKIIKADETHQFYISFTTLLKNFNRENLTIFEKPDEQDAVWKSQRSVHGWHW
nr:hypothetical protein [Tanacetum cinerariifolium]